MSTATPSPLTAFAQHPTFTAVRDTARGSCIDPLYAATKIFASCPEIFPTLPPFSTPQFAAFDPLASVVGADAGRYRDAVTALTEQRDEISDIVVTGTTLVATAVGELVDTAISMVRNASAAAAAAAVGGPLAQLSAAAPVVITGLLKAGAILETLGNDLDGLADRLNQTTLAMHAREALVASPVAQEAQRTLGELVDRSPLAAIRPTATPVPETRPAAQPVAASVGGGEPGPAGDATPPELGEPVSPASPASTAGSAAVQAAKSQIGTPYTWGGSQPGGFDCSGLTSWAYGQAGVDIPRTAAEQAVGQQVAYEDLQEGDLVVWDGHVAMYAGDGMMIEAGDPVQLNPVRTENIGMPFRGFWRPTA